MVKKNKIPAVFKEDLQELLQSIQEYEPIKKGDRICKGCAKVITLENIQLIIPRAENFFDYVCNDSVCVEEYNRNKLTHE